jgi:hypothetical protein
MIHAARQHIDDLKYRANRCLGSREGYQWLTVDYAGRALVPIPGSKLEHKAALIDPLLPRLVPGRVVLDIGCDKGYFSWSAWRHGASLVYANEIHPKVGEFLKTTTRYMRWGVVPVADNLFAPGGRQIEADYVLALAVLHQVENMTLGEAVAKVRALIEFCGDYRQRLGPQWTLEEFAAAAGGQFASVTCLASYPSMNGGDAAQSGTRYLYDCRCH